LAMTNFWQVDCPVNKEYPLDIEPVRAQLLANYLAVQTSLPRYGSAGGIRWSLRL